MGASERGGDNAGVIARVEDQPRGRRPFLCPPLSRKRERGSESRPEDSAQSQRTGTGGTGSMCQMSRLYSAMVRSEEK